MSTKYYMKIESILKVITFFFKALFVALNLYHGGIRPLLWRLQRQMVCFAPYNKVTFSQGINQQDPRYTGDCITQCRKHVSKISFWMYQKYTQFLLLRKITSECWSTTTRIPLRKDSLILNWLLIVDQTETERHHHSDCNRYLPTNLTARGCSASTTTTTTSVIVIDGIGDRVTTTTTTAAAATTTSTIATGFLGSGSSSTLRIAFCWTTRIVVFL